MKNMEYYTDNPERTMQIGIQLSKQMKMNEIYLLQGELGAGKTTLTQGICQGLDCNQQAASPTFTLVNQYDGNLRVYHIDLYRLENERQVIQLDLEEYYDAGGVCLIEWPQRMGRFIPEGSKRIEVVILNENRRCIRVSE